ncbi:MAG TPA: glycine dehydrogenase, partial [Polyangiaceae bacterium]
MMRYLPHTDEEIAAMLAVIGKGSVDELFTSIPEEARFKGALKVPDPLDEASLMAQMKSLAEKNTAATMLSFLGAGAYAHHFPPAVDQLLLRSEFYTAYTPYQPEVAQGTLQAIWEFQTIVSELYGLPLANASLYDGASATAEGAQMARRLTKRDRVLVCRSVHPDYRKVTETYLGGEGNPHYAEVGIGTTGATDPSAVGAALSDQTACIV